MGRDRAQGSAKRGRRAAWALAMAFTACAPATSGRDFDIAAVQRIKIGVTTAQDVRGMFGEPTAQDVADRTLTTWTYSFARHDVVVKTLSVTLHRDVVTDCRLAVREPAAASSGAGESRRSQPAEPVPCGY